MGVCVGVSLHKNLMRAVVVRGAVSPARIGKASGWQGGDLVVGNCKSQNQDVRIHTPLKGALAKRWPTSVFFVVPCFFFLFFLSVSLLFFLLDLLDD